MTPLAQRLEADDRYGQYEGREQRRPRPSRRSMGRARWDDGHLEAKAYGGKRRRANATLGEG